VFKTLSPDLIRRWLTSLFPAEVIEDIARERDVVQRDRKIDITMLVWTLIMGFAVEWLAQRLHVREEFLDPGVCESKTLRKV